MAAPAGVARLMADEVVLTRIAPGRFRLEHGGRNETVYVAGPPTDRWAFWNGHVFHTRRTERPR